MTIGWGWKITILYSVFVAMIVGLVIASSHQKIDLVSKDYYKDEIAYQKVLDASKNQASLEGALTIHADGREIFIEFPKEFSDKFLTGNVKLYSASHQEWDRNFPINTSGGRLSIPRSNLQHTLYTIKVSYTVGEKSYYSESQLDLHAS